MIMEGFHLDPSQYFNILDEPEQTTTITNSQQTQDLKEEKSKRKRGILCVFLLTLDKPHHKLAVENWLLNRPEQELNNPAPKEQLSIMVKNFRHIQDYLQSFSEKLQVLQVDFQELDNNLDILHDSVLNKIQQIFATEPDLIK